MSPIATLIFFHGMDGTIQTPSGGPLYDPGNAPDWRPGENADVAVRGAFQKASVTGLDSSFFGTFTIEATSLPAGLQPGKSALTFALGTKIIMAVDPRQWAGVVDGYVLKLAA